MEAILQANPAVATYSRRMGTQLGGGLTEANEGDFFVRLKPMPRPPIDKVMDQVRGQVERNVPGLNIEMALLMEDLIGDLTAVPQPVEIKLSDDDSQALLATARGWPPPSPTFRS
jgi:multidrug efflux pump subunit AcrB